MCLRMEPLEGDSPVQRDYPRYFGEGHGRWIDPSTAPQVVMKGRLRKFLGCSTRGIPLRCRQSDIIVEPTIVNGIDYYRSSRVTTRPLRTDAASVTLVSRPHFLLFPYPRTASSRRRTGHGANRGTGAAPTEYRIPGSLTAKSPTTSPTTTTWST